MNALAIVARATWNFWEQSAKQNVAKQACPRSGLFILWALGFRFARMTLAPLNHIALASEPAES
jgi:hypothetical protein